MNDYHHHHHPTTNHSSSSSSSSSSSAGAIHDNKSDPIHMNDELSSELQLLEQPSSTRIANTIDERSTNNDNNNKKDDSNSGTNDDSNTTTTTTTTTTTINNSNHHHPKNDIDSDSMTFLLLDQMNIDDDYDILFGRSSSSISHNCTTDMNNNNNKNTLQQAEKMSCVDRNNDGNVHHDDDENNTTTTTTTTTIRTNDDNNIEVQWNDDHHHNNNTKRKQQKSLFHWMKMKQKFQRHNQQQEQFVHNNNHTINTNVDHNHSTVTPTSTTTATTTSIKMTNVQDQQQQDDIQEEINEIMFHYDINNNKNHNNGKMMMMILEPILNKLEYYFSKHYVPNVTDIVTLQQIQYEIFGSNNNTINMKNIIKQPTSLKFLLPSFLVQTSTSNNNDPYNSNNISQQQQLQMWNTIVVDHRSSSSKSTNHHDDNEPKSTSHGIVIWRSDELLINQKNNHIKNISYNDDDNYYIQQQYRNNRRGLYLCSTDMMIMSQNSVDNDVLPTSTSECEMILCTTGMMILLASSSNNQLHDDDNNNDNSTVCCKKYIHTSLLWSQIEYIDAVLCSSRDNNKVDVNYDDHSIMNNNADNTSIPSLLPSNIDSTNSLQNTIYNLNSSPNQVRMGIRIQFKQDTTDITNTGTNDNNKHTTDESTLSNTNVILLCCQNTKLFNLYYTILLKTFIQYHTYHQRPTIPNQLSTTPTTLGWQYQYVYQPYYTMAVTCRIDDDFIVSMKNRSILSRRNIPKNDKDPWYDDNNDTINLLDIYNGMAPLHYAIYYRHTPAIDMLLQLGANPNFQDRENHYTPLDYCVMYDVSNSTIELLQQYGATKLSTPFQGMMNMKSKNDISNPSMSNNDNNGTTMSLRGELFGKVKATEQIMDERRRKQRQLEQHVDATNTLTQEIQKNHMQLLHDRGDKIEALGHNANQLNQNAYEYSTMSKQLKDKLKQRHDNYNKWFPF